MPASSGLHLEWQDIRFEVGGSKIRSCVPCFEEKTKEILHGISGSVAPAQVLAVMGSSGAGKTTFLNILAQQPALGGASTGNVLIDGEIMTKQLFRKHCGYVKQDDVLLPNLTVRETISFYASLRLPSSMTSEQRSERVTDTISKLGLSHCQHSFIGGQRERGISGGEKRRVSIAVELIRNPTILFLDEPTSGLDARTSLSVVNTLSDLAHNHNHTIVCTIHQPRSQAFMKFDQLILLAKGNQIFSGPVADAQPYFADWGYECPAFENPADFYIDLLTLNTTSLELEEESKRRVNEIIENAAQQKYEPEPFHPDDKIQDDDDHDGAGRIKQTYLIARRSLMNVQRNGGYLVARFAQVIIMAICISVLWWQIDNDQLSIQDRLGVVFITLLGGAFPEAMTSASVFPLEREVFRREKKAGMYKLMSYYIGKQLAEFPLQILAPSVFAIFIYWCVGLPADIWIFGTFLSLVMLMALCVNSLGMLIGALFPIQAALILIPCTMLISLLLAGFYVHPDNLPVWIEWAKYISIFFYANQSIILNQFEDLDLYCKDDQYVTLTATGTCSSGQIVSVSQTKCPVTHGSRIVEDQGADEFTIWQYQIILLTCVCALRILLYFALKYANPKEADA